MTELFYVFVKGKGWVIEQSTPYPDAEGRLWYIELREPRPGEYCCWVFDYDHWDLQSWVSWLRLPGVAPHDYSTLEYNIGNPNLAWCTFIPVNP